MKHDNSITTSETKINPNEYELERIRMRRLGKTQDYYAKKLNRTQGLVSQALSGTPGTKKFFDRIVRHNDWLESRSSLIQKN